MLEFDDSRSGSFEPLKEVTEEKTVVLGLVSTKRPLLESQTDLIQRIQAAARFLPLDRLALSPQCGFASSVMGNRVSITDQLKKLRRVVETARAVWG